MEKIIKFTGWASSLGTGRGQETIEAGNRLWVATCGCEASSGAGAYGTSGGARVVYPCHKHDEEIGG